MTEKTEEKTEEKKLEQTGTVLQLREMAYENAAKFKEQWVEEKETKQRWVYRVKSFWLDSVFYQAEVNFGGHDAIHLTPHILIGGRQIFLTNVFYNFLTAGQDEKIIKAIKSRTFTKIDCGTPSEVREIISQERDRLNRGLYALEVQNAFKEHDGINRGENMAAAISGESDPVFQRYLRFAEEYIKTHNVTKFNWNSPFAKMVSPPSRMPTTPGPASDYESPMAEDDEIPF